MATSPYIFLRGLRIVDLSIFNVAAGQKHYTDYTMGKPIVLPFSSGQQVKRSIKTFMLDSLNESEAMITFRKKLKEATDSRGSGEAITDCDPRYYDLLFGGWMRADKRDKSKAKGIKKKASDEDGEDSSEDSKEKVIKRRSPFSISALTPLHPYLAGMNTEHLVIDRSDNPSKARFEFTDNNGGLQASAEPDKSGGIVFKDATGELISKEKLVSILGGEEPNMQARLFKKDAKKTANGVFKYDVAIDLRRLFSINTQLEIEPELRRETLDGLLKEGWVESENAFGPCITAPKIIRDRFIPAVASALIRWRITSNQSRDLDLGITSAIAISNEAADIAAAIRSKLDGEKRYWDHSGATVVLDKSLNNLFIHPAAEEVVDVKESSASALSEAQALLIHLMQAYPYENQLAR